jgi:hypothetical protein
MREEMRSARGLAALAAAQHGVVSTRQLNELGYTASAIGRRLKAGRLHRIHRGVYSVGNPAVSPHGRCLAAVLASGEGALLSHGSAAWLWGIAPTCPRISQVTVPRRGHGRAAIRVHHVGTLVDADRSSVDGIAVTALPRTLLDLAASERPRRLQKLVDRAKRLALLDLAAIDALLDRRPGAPGSPALRSALALYRHEVFDRARSELLFLQLVERAGIRQPALNTWVAGHVLDAYWDRERFAVEIDGWKAHGTRAAFEADRLRDEELKLAGIDVIRVTARRIEREPDRVAARLQALLARRREELRQRRERS